MSIDKKLSENDERRRGFKRKSHLIKMSNYLSNKHFMFVDDFSLPVT